MPRHPTFYLPIEIVRAVEVRSFRTSSRGMEASRCRGMMRYSVICDPDTAADLIPKIEAVRARAEHASFHATCDASIAAIRAAIEEARPYRYRQPSNPATKNRATSAHDAGMRLLR